MLESTTDRVDILDLGECTVLLTLGFSLVRLEQSREGAHKIFVFDRMHPNTSTRTVESTLEDYQRRRLQVDAYSFYRSIKDIKSRIHDHNELLKRG